MIINENPYGVEFEEDEVVWQLNNKEVSYEEILKAVSSPKGVKNIICGSPDDYPYDFETEESVWELSWDIRINFYDGKYKLSTYIYAISNEYYDDLSDLEESEPDYQEVATKYIAELRKKGYPIFEDDTYLELEGDYVHDVNKTFDTLEEAFANIPSVFGRMCVYLEAKDNLLYYLREYYSEKE